MGCERMRVIKDDPIECMTSAIRRMVLLLTEIRKIGGGEV